MTDPKKYGDALLDIVSQYGKRYGLVPIPEPKGSYDAATGRVSVEFSMPARTLPCGYTVDGGGWCRLPANHEEEHDATPDEPE